MSAMRPLLCCLIAAATFVPFHGAVAQNAAPAEVAYVIPIHDMIERALVYFIRRAMDDAAAAQADVIVIDMDTPGGRLDATEQIIKMLTDTSAETYTFVNPNAFSAGAIIAMATRHIYMSPGACIGDAMPIMMSPLPFGGPQALPEGLKEKATSPTVAMIRSAAQRNGHDPQLAECMVRPEKEYKIGDTAVCPKGELLTLTSEDAARRLGPDNKPLLSEGTVDSVQQLLKQAGHAGARVVTVQISPTEKLGRLIESFPVSGILLGLGLLCLYIEFRSPGFGLPGIAGIVLLLIWFWGHHVAGLAGTGELMLFLLGLTLLLIEIFLIPGFGIVGLSGLVLVVVALGMAMVQHYPGTPWYNPPDLEVQRMVVNLALTLISVSVAGAVLSRFLPKTALFHRLTLDTSLAGGDGVSAPDAPSPLIGREGIADTECRPAGIGTFGDDRLSVVARGAYIEKGTPIVVAEVHGNRIVVDKKT